MASFEELLAQLAQAHEREVEQAKDAAAAAASPVQKSSSVRHVASSSTVRLRKSWVLNNEDVGSAAMRRPSCCEPTSPTASLPRVNAAQAAMSTLFLLIWDAMGAACILLDLIWIPVQVGFSIEGSDGALEWALRAFWSLDLPLKAAQACERVDGRWALSRLRWLVFDIVMVVMDWLPVLIGGESAGHQLGLLRIGKVPRVLRVLRVLRLAWMMKLQRFFLAMGENVLVSSESVSLLLGLLRNMFCVLLLCHLSTCSWFLIGNRDGGWVQAHDLQRQPLTEQYLWSFHWVAAQWTPGSMEVHPTNSAERAFTAVLVVGGVMMFSTFMGAITAAMTRLRSLAGNSFSQSFLLRHYLRQNRISVGLSMRICRCADLAQELHRRRIGEESVQNLKLLSKPLHLELRKEIFLPQLKRHRFFAGYMDWDAAAMSQLCYSALAKEFLARGDELFSLGAEAGKMYCVISGVFHYQRRRSLHLRRAQDRPKRAVRAPAGTWACEAALWLCWHHAGDMSALVESEVVHVDAEKFREVTVHREGVFARAALYARTFARNMLDQNGMGWDLPTEMMYGCVSECDTRRGTWFRKESYALEVLDAEEQEGYLAAQGDSESEYEEEEDGSDHEDASVKGEVLTSEAISL